MDVFAQVILMKINLNMFRTPKKIFKHIKNLRSAISHSEYEMRNVISFSPFQFIRSWVSTHSSLFIKYTIKKSSNVKNVGETLHS